MAISPIILKDKFLNHVDVLEKVIDETLSNQTIIGGTVTIPAPRELSSTHLTILKQRYLDVGWKDVLYHPNQIDGDWLEFKV